MNKDTIQGNFEQLKGKIKESWGKLTDDDISLLNGKKEQFFGKVQEHYGMGKDEAQKHVDEMSRSCGYCAKEDKVA
jgi:uncharacterized protein YjbJ (UPF0337 family)